MNLRDGFRNPKAAAVLAQRIHELARPLTEGGKILRIMEVCGSHTTAVGRFGLRAMLPPGLRLVSGPGCPVCVTGPGYVDAAIELGRRGIEICTFGDLLRVPGSGGASLTSARAEGIQITSCYSPVEALHRAESQPEREFVFLAVGFETTAVPILLMLDHAQRAGIKNLSLLTAFKRVPPAMMALAEDPALAIDGFLCPAHVSAIIGANAYIPVAIRCHRPCVVAGFEPLDILYGIEGVLRQMQSGEGRVENQYSRVVTAAGNVESQRLLARYLEPVAADWRGLGRMPGSGLGLRPEYAFWDTSIRHATPILPGEEPAGCRCGEVLRGLLDPPDCPLFGRRCRPESPVGACMVSAEGSCAARYREHPVPGALR